MVYFKQVLLNVVLFGGTFAFFKFVAFQEAATPKAWGAVVFSALLYSFTMPLFTKWLNKYFERKQRQKQHG